MWEILVKIGIVIIVVLLFIFTGSFLSMWVRKPLIELCNKRNLNASPWKFFLWELFFCYLFLTNENETGVMSVWYVKVLLFLLILLPILVLFYRAKFFFGPLILIKLACIPLDLLYVITGCYKDKDYKANNSRIASDKASQGGSGFSGSWSQDGNLPQTISVPYSDTNATYHSSFEYMQNSYVFEKYRDMEYTRQNSEENYHTVNQGENTAYYNGEYAPFAENGGSVEVRTYDSDYAPME